MLVVNVSTQKPRKIVGIIHTQNVKGVLNRDLTA